jgi:hypothetical protein
MPIHDFYANRVRSAEQGNLPASLVYDQLAPFLREQLISIFSDCIGPGFHTVG